MFRGDAARDQRTRPTERQTKLKLFKTLEILKIKRTDTSAASKVVNEIVDTIFKHLKNNTLRFKEVEEPLRIGSYCEHLKISKPDGFDVMMPIPVDPVTVEPVGDDGASYRVKLKRKKSLLQTFAEAGTLSASRMLKKFREEVKKSVQTCTAWTVERNIVVKSRWPPATKDGIKIDGWLGRIVKQEHKRKPFYLVPKYEGNGTTERDGVLATNAWRISFSHVEKAIMINHGSEKTCCENGSRCCRKQCLQLLKHLLSLLKANSSFDKFCSYHAKTTLLHACCSRTKDSDWKLSNLSQCFRQLLMDFVAHLEARVLNNFFIPTQNLLAGPSKKQCRMLARLIRKECDEGFPSFIPPTV